jgi:uncharacterized protein DUF6249
MDGFPAYAWAFLIPIVAIIGGIMTAVVGIISRTRIRELEIRERIAMIERGLVPPPEKDPQGFERAMGQYERYRHQDDEDWRGRHRSPGRYRRSGITMIGVGLGLMLLIGVAGENMNSAIGVGGFLVIMGFAFFLNSLFERSAYDPRRYPVSPPPPPAAPQPPSFGGNDPTRTP